MSPSCEGFAASGVYDSISSDATSTFQKAHDLPVVKY